MSRCVLAGPCTLKAAGRRVVGEPRSVSRLGLNLSTIEGDALVSNLFLCWTVTLGLYCIFVCWWNEMKPQQPRSMWIITSAGFLI